MKTLLKIAVCQEQSCWMVRGYRLKHCEGRRYAALQEQGLISVSMPLSTSADKMQKEAIKTAYTTLLLELRAKGIVQTFVPAASCLPAVPPFLPGKIPERKTPQKKLPDTTRPIEIDLDTDMVSLMESKVHDLHYAKELKREGADPDDEILEDYNGGYRRRRLSPAELDSRSKTLQAKAAAFVRQPRSSEVMRTRKALPMNEWKDRVLRHVQDHAYSIIIGATGSGKTTQVPQIILEDAITKDKGGFCDIICTQPRKIAATSVARRVADERLEPLQQTVGYQVRFDSRLPQRGGSITYCTTGILLQQLQNASDDVLDTTSHLIIDEVHERDILIDFLLNIIRRTARARRAARKTVPTIILMSATIESTLFSDYFAERGAGGVTFPCPSLSVPGRTFPVKEKYLTEIMSDLERAHGRSLMENLDSENETRRYLAAELTRNPDNGYAGKKPVIESTNGRIARENEFEDAIVPMRLVAMVVGHIARKTPDGAILVFLPGLDEMKTVRTILEKERPLAVDFVNFSQFRISMLHSSVPAHEQAAVFEQVPAGCRKIIISTNIAETSVTIPDVQYIVDSGKLREKRYDQLRRITKLQCTWISHSNAKQRAGRAGRVQNGNYYALYTKERRDALRPIGLPEMLRSELQEICLDIKAHEFGCPIQDFLEVSIEPPSSEAIRAAITALQSLQALTEDEKLTALGRLLAKLPVHPSLGKMVVLGVISRCLDPMIILGAALHERSPFVAPLEERAAANLAHRPFFEGRQSDHIALINVIRQVRRIENAKGVTAAKQFCGPRYLHYGAYETIALTADQIEEVLIDAGLIPYTHQRNRFEAEVGERSLNRFASDDNVIIALIVAGMHPNVGVWQGRPLRTLLVPKTMIHPASTNSCAEDDPPKRGTLCAFSTLVKGNKGGTIFLRDTSISTPLMSILFGGRLSISGSIITANGWLPFDLRAGSKAATALLEFRRALDQTLAEAFESLAKMSKNLDAVYFDEVNYLADDVAVDTLSSALMKLLDLDVTKHERLARRPVSVTGMGKSGPADGSQDEFDIDIEIED